MFTPLGVTIRVPESQQDAVTALSGSGPAYFYLLVEAMDSLNDREKHILTERRLTDIVFISMPDGYWVAVDGDRLAPEALRDAFASL